MTTAVEKVAVQSRGRNGPRNQLCQLAFDIGREMNYSNLKKQHESKSETKSRGRKRPRNKKATPRFATKLRSYVRTHTRWSEPSSHLHLVSTANMETDGVDPP